MAHTTESNALGQKLLWYILTTAVGILLLVGSFLAAQVWANTGRLAVQETKVTALETQFTSIDTKLDRIDSKIDRVDGKITAHLLNPNTPLAAKKE
jgi:peptidoglycan hydrolase CwlO-like protein